MTIAMKERKSLIKYMSVTMFVVLVVMSVEKVPAADVVELVTDRPDQTESSVTIPPGRIQIETGSLYTEENENGQHSRTFEFPGTLIRVGFSDRIELRFAFDGWTREFVNNDDGYGDTELGIKTYFWKESGWRPETALLTSTSISTGEKGFSSDQSDPSFRFLFSHTLSEKVFLGYNLGAAWETSRDKRGDRDTLSAFQYTGTIGIGITNRLGTFIEFFGDVPINARGTPANSFDAGITYLIRDNLQFDIFGGLGLSNRADDWFLGLGFSYLVPQ